MYSLTPLSVDIPIALSALDPVVMTEIQHAISAGFPSPAEDNAGRRIDLNEVLIRHPQATFLMRVRGASMREAGIDDGDTLIVDRALKAVHGRVVVAVVDGDFTVKRLWKRGDNVKLQAANPTYPDIVPRDGQTLEVWGVVTHAIKNLQG